MADLKVIAENVFAGKAEVVKELVKKALAEKVGVKEILDQGLIAGMGEVGRKFKANEIYVPEVLIAARAMHAGMDILEPLLVSEGIEPVGKVVIGTVKGDLHDIGKNLVAMMLKGAGFQVHDIGIDVPKEKFVDSLKETGAKILALSALLTTTMPSMKGVLDGLKDAGLRDGVRIMVGGAPVTQDYADEIGADGYAEDAASAAELAKKLIEID